MHLVYLLVLELKNPKTNFKGIEKIQAQSRASTFEHADKGTILLKGLILIKGIQLQIKMKGVSFGKKPTLAVIVL